MQKSFVHFRASEDIKGFIALYRHKLFAAKF